MKTQSLGWLVGLGAAASCFSSCTEPATECQVALAGYNSYATVYIAKGSPSPAGCEMTNPKVVQLGDIIGMEYYHPPSADGTTYDDNKSTVTIKSNSIGLEYGQYNAGCVPAACPAVTCASDADCDPAGKLMNVCVNGVCTQAACATAGDCGGSPCVNGSCAQSCGPIADGCGGLSLPAGAGQGQTDCGTCPAGQTCGGGGTPNFCGSGTPCVPQTCADLMATCGPAGDGCGGTLMCGTCPQPPATCSTDADCGDAAPCVMNACANPQTCGGNGIPGTCGHVLPDLKASDSLWATASFAQHYPDANNMCQLTNLTPAVQTFSSGPTMTSLPTDTIGYVWSNVNVYVTAAAQGTQFTADLTYTENGCSAAYHAVGVWPAVDCTDPVYDPQNPKKVIGQVPNQDTCNPCAEPSKQRFVGSGIIPDFPVTCKQIFPTTCTGGNCLSADPFGRDPFYCVIDGTKDIPQLDPNPPTCQ